MDIVQPLQLDRPLDADTVSLLRKVDQHAKALKIDYFVGGAQARIVILEHVFREPPGRATRDVDIGICVADWPMHDRFKARLVESGQFEAVAKNPHKLIYLVPGGGRMQLDVIPFGDVENPAASIAWPPQGDTVMNVAGFPEAARAAVAVQIDADLRVPFASLPAMAILKLLAWRDRHHDSKRDATDLLILLSCYEAAGNQDRLYEKEFDLMGQHEYDIDLAAAALLAKDGAAIVSGEARAQILQVFGDAQQYALLLEHMAYGDRQALHDGGMDPQRVHARMAAYRDTFMAVA